MSRETKRHITCLAILLTVIAGVWIWQSGFSRRGPSIRFVESNKTAEGFPFAVSRMINPTGQPYNHEGDCQNSLKGFG